jgi:hypothetical protein
VENSKFQMLDTGFRLASTTAATVNVAVVWVFTTTTSSLSLRVRENASTPC